MRVEDRGSILQKKVLKLLDRVENGKSEVRSSAFVDETVAAINTTVLQVFFLLLKNFILY